MAYAHQYTKGDLSMNHKIAQLLAPRFGLYFIAMIILAGITALLGHTDVALAEVIVIVLMYSVYRTTTVRRKKVATNYLEWRRDRLPTPVFLGLPCGSAGKESTCNAGDLGLILGLGRSLGEGKGYPLQYFGLENSRDCIVHGVAKSRT